MKVLILSCNTGGGHNSAAHAIQQEMLSRGIECQIVDALSFGPYYFSQLISKLHTIAYRYFPRVFGYGYRWKEQIDLSERTSFEYKMNAICVPKLYRYIRSNHFDTIITPHVFPGEMLKRIRKKYHCIWNTYFISTDYTCCPCANEIQPSYWVIPDERLRPEFVKKGIPTKRILSLGIPTAPRFEQPVSQKAARQELNLPEDGQLVLVMSGSIGCGPMETLTARLLHRLPHGAHVVTICGRNKNLYKDISRLAKRHKNVIPVQFTDKVDLYLSAANVVVTKPGGLSSTEIAQKGTPAVFLLTVPGCESRNLEFFSRYGMAESAETVREAITAVLHLLGSASARQAMREKQATLPHHSAANICDFICQKNHRLPKKDKQENHIPISIS